MARAYSLAELAGATLLGLTLLSCGLNAIGTRSDPGLPDGAPQVDGSSPPKADGGPGNDAATRIDSALDSARDADAAEAVVDANVCADGTSPCGAQCIQTTSDPSHCGGCTVACTGSDASCAASVCSATLRVRGYIDALAQFVIQGNQAHWFNQTGAAPGLWQGADQPTYIDGTAWTPTWPASGENRDCSCSSSNTTVTMLASRSQTVALSIVMARGTVTITQQPSAANGYTAIIQFDDSGAGLAGPDWYEVILGYDTT